MDGVLLQPRPLGFPRIRELVGRRCPIPFLEFAMKRLFLVAAATALRLLRVAVPAPA